MDDVTPLVLGLVMVMAYVLVIPVGVVTNALSAIVWLRRQVTSKNSSAIYLAATAINDIVHLLSLFTIPFLMCSSFSHGWLCFITYFAQFSSYTLEPLLVLGFSVERLYAVYRPLQVSFTHESYYAAVRIDLVII